MDVRRACLGKFILFGMLLGQPVFAANVADFSDFSLRDDSDNVVLPGRLFVPPEAAIEPRPLVLYLHGSGENGTNNLNQIGVTINFLLEEVRDAGAYLYAPQTSNNWNSLTITDRAISMIDRAVDERQVDPKRIYVIGFSNGGGGAWNMLSRYQDQFAAAVPVSGVSPAGDFVAANLTGVPIWAFHARDDGTVPVSVTRHTINSILAAANEPLPSYPTLSDPANYFFSNGNLYLQYNELAAAGHNIWGGISRFPKVYEWLFLQSLSVPEPNSTTIAALMGVMLILRRRTRK